MLSIFSEPEKFETSKVLNAKPSLSGYSRITLLTNIFSVISLNPYQKQHQTPELKVLNSPVFPIAALTSDHEPFVIGVSFHCTSNIYLALEGFREGRRT